MKSVVRQPMPKVETGARVTSLPAAPLPVLKRTLAGDITQVQAAEGGQLAAIGLQGHAGTGRPGPSPSPWRHPGLSVVGLVKQLIGVEVFHVHAHGQVLVRGQRRGVAEGDRVFLERRVDVGAVDAAQEILDRRVVDVAEVVSSWPWDWPLECRSPGGWCRCAISGQSHWNSCLRSHRDRSPWDARGACRRGQRPCGFAACNWPRGSRGKGHAV